MSPLFGGTYCLHHNFSTLRMEAVDISEALVNFYQSTRYHIPWESCHLLRNSTFEILQCCLLHVLAHTRRERVTWPFMLQGRSGTLTQHLEGPQAGGVKQPDWPSTAHLPQPVCIPRVGTRRSDPRNANRRGLPESDQPMATLAALGGNPHLQQRYECTTIFLRVKTLGLPGFTLQWPTFMVLIFSTGNFSDQLNNYLFHFGCRI
jgi:hypothetical protein